MVRFMKMVLFCRNGKDFTFIETLYFNSVMIDYVCNCGKRLPAAQDDDPHAIRDGDSPEHDGDPPFASSS
jgi:hypothetical protein